VLALALTGTLLAFWLFAWAQARVPAALAGAFVNLEPLVGALTGALAFHDAFGAAQIAGGTAILAGIALGALPRDRRLVAEEPTAGTVAGERRRPDDARRAVGRRTAPRTAHVGRHHPSPPTPYRVDQHAGPRERVREHQRQRVQPSLRD
jgi:hypothetical protein